MLEIAIIRPRGDTTYRNSFVTDLAVRADTVVELAACGRASWKIENETFNVLQNKGYNLGHCFGHGKHNLAAFVVSLSLLTSFNKLAAIAIYLIFPSWDDLLLNLAFAKPPPILP